MMRHRPPLLIAFSALFGLLHTAAVAQAPSKEVTPDARAAPLAPAEALGATLDELTARVQQLSQRAGSTAELAETVIRAIQRLAQSEEGIAAEAVAVRQLLAATRDRIAELDAARAEDGAIIARLQTELDAARAEGERLEASRRGLEELSAGLAAAVADFPRVAAAGGGEADRREAAGAGPRVSPPARSAPPSGARSAGDGAAETPADGAEYYAATRTMNLRAAPASTAEVLAVVGDGDVVRGIGREGRWRRVEYGNAGSGAITGWMHGGLLRNVEAPSQDGTGGG